MTTDFVHDTPRVGDVVIIELSPRPDGPSDYRHGRPSGRGGRAREFATRTGAGLQSWLRRPFPGGDVAHDHPNAVRSPEQWVRRARDRWRVSMQGRATLDMEQFGEAVDVARTWLSGTDGRIYRQEFGGTPQVYDEP